ncbi:MAG TPA: FAD-dependent oxidoreductase [Miltoncostaeaceae bacterium]|nr:FAD-dependent oxidoreductase [Miltoncostaeaceae bacterium]
MSHRPDARFDVVVVGSGGAGMSAAWAAARVGASVLVVTKSALGASNTGRAQGGIQAAVGPDDTPESHFADTFAAGHRAARPELARKLTAEGPAAVAFLERIGVEFSRDDGALRILRCGGASRPRLLQAGERTGAEMVRSLRRAVHDADVTVWESTALRSMEPGANGWRLRTRDAHGAAPAAPAPDRVVDAGAVVLAAGGGLRGEAQALGVGSTNHPDATPEVLRLAIDLGARAVHVDSWQRHPTGSVWPAALSGYALPETTRAYGATLHDRDGDRFVDELAPRDVVADAITRAVEEGRGDAAPDGRPGVWLDTPAIDRTHGAGFTARRLAYVHNRYAKAGVDITRERVLVYPVLHYRNGGLAIDEDAGTTLPGVFAAGEITGGVHGTNRLMGNSLLDTVVFGLTAGRSAAAAAR